MNLCRFEINPGEVRVGLVESGDAVIDLSAAQFGSLSQVLEDPDAVRRLEAGSIRRLPRHRLSDVRLKSPVDRQEVWAAGVTYKRSKTARMEESALSANAYDRVYDAPRPELFFKSLPEKVVGPGELIGVRADAQWNVPEPELALVINSKGCIAGYTIGNDMSSRDIEGENLLYLPQAKIYDRSCALGPWVTVGVAGETVRSWQIDLRIERGNAVVLSAKTTVGNIKRSFPELAAYLFRSQSFSHGAILLTGTGIVPPEDFGLEPSDRVLIGISGIGQLSNEVVKV